MVVLNRIRDWLTEFDVKFKEVHHEPTRTSEESARARGVPLKTGGKALLLKVGSDFRLFVLSADLKLDSDKVKKQFNERSLRFAKPEELKELTGLVPGSVPPFGEPVNPFKLYVDPSVFEQEIIAFNAGSLTDSMILTIADYRRVFGGEVFQFAAAAEQQS